MLIALSVAWPLGARESTAQGFSQAERAKLDEGKLVQRPKSESRDGWNLIGGQAWQVIDMSPEAVWRAANDFDHYPKMVPGLRTAKVSRRKDHVVHVTFRHVYGALDVSYPLRFEFRPEEKVAVFRLDHTKPSDLRAGWGFFRIRPWKNGRTLLTVSGLVDIGSGILVSIIRPAVKRYLLLIPSVTKGFLEGDGRALYGG